MRWLSWRSPPNSIANSAPEAEVNVEAALVRALIESQFPEFAALKVERFASGWDNDMFRLGDEYAVRLPRRLAAVALLANEQRWLPTIATHVPMPIPAPIGIGQPSHGYPWMWSVLPWFQGLPGDEAPLRSDAGAQLASFLQALHVPAPNDAPHNIYRGVPLTQRASNVEERLQRLRRNTTLINSHIELIWTEALAAPIDVTPTWLHGDLHAQNILVDAGKISAVIDWGDLCAGDCATDLAAIWMLLPDRQARIDAMHEYAASPATWQRARGWAVLFASVLADTGLTNNPRHAAMAQSIFKNLMAGP